MGSQPRASLADAVSSYHSAMGDYVRLSLEVDRHYLIGSQPPASLLAAREASAQVFTQLGRVVESVRNEQPALSL